MEKLDELRQQIASMFDNAEDKATIEQLAVINNTIDEVSKEQDELISKHKDLMADYKEVIKHTSFKGGNNIGDTVPGVTTPLSFEDALKEFMSTKDK